MILEAGEEQSGKESQRDHCESDANPEGISEVPAIPSDKESPQGADQAQRSKHEENPEKQHLSSGTEARALRPFASRARRPPAA